MTNRITPSHLYSYLSCPTRVARDAFADPSLRLPFFIFNYYFVFIVPVFSRWMLLDVIGNVGILVCGIWGWHLKKREGERQ
jgi:hypothetical protein